MATVTESHDTQRERRSGVPSALVLIAALALLGLAAVGIATMNGEQASMAPNHPSEMTSSE